MEVFKTKWFSRFARQENIPDRSLIEAVRRAERGLIDADLGGDLIKQRLAREGKGRSGGYRTIIAYRDKHRAIFLYGFAKSERDNIGSDELVSFRSAGKYWLNVSPGTIRASIDDGAIQEVADGPEEG